MVFGKSPVENMGMRTNRRKFSRRECAREVIGIIPAGGWATRLRQLPCSKELYPVGFMKLNDDQRQCPKVACHYLLEKLRLAGISKTYIVLREGKWDIPAYFRSGKLLDMNLGYLMVEVPFGVPYTVDQAYAFVKGSVVALGFPDIVFQDDDVFVRLIDRKMSGHADVVLGLFPADCHEKVDMVDVEEDGHIHAIIIKPRRTSLYYTWGVALWAPQFSEFMHQYLPRIEQSPNEEQELHLGDVIVAAMKEGMRVEGIRVSDDPYIDIGTPEDLVRAVRTYAEQ